MSDKFNGFSQEDINKLSTKTCKTRNTILPRGIRRMPDKKAVAKSVDKLKDLPNVNAVKDKDESIEINLDQSMSESLEGALFFKPIVKSDDVHREQLDDSSILKMPVTNSDLSDDSSILHEHITNQSPFKGISLKDFETHRKIIEEQNKQKKDILHKAIEAHSKKTAAETKKIEEIKIELAKLDNELATDVALLRKQIDSACINYTNIEKQYHRIEAQFLKAKIELHNASEKKELLTEHLCTVIAHNEDRKAQKLSELMQKVGLTPCGDLVESNGFHNDDSI